VQELRAMAGVDYRVVVGKMEEKDMLEEEERKKGRKKERKKIKW
jgi:ribosomal protein S12